MMVLLKLFKLMPPIAWAGIALSAVTVVGGFAAYMQYVGAQKVIKKYERRDADRRALVHKQNFEIDRETIDADAVLTRRLQEIETKWNADPKPPPSQAQTQ